MTRAEAIAYGTVARLRAGHLRRDGQGDAAIDCDEADPDDDLDGGMALELRRVIA